MPIISQHLGNILSCKTEAVVVTVNCVGFMGKGMALECALRYPVIEASYKSLCKKGEVTIGKMNWLQTPDGQNVILFPTKIDFKFPSKMSYIENGLTQLERDVRDRGLGSIAIPRLGSELGGLDWSHVHPKILQAFATSNVELELWEFSSEQGDPLLLRLLAKLENGTAVGLVDGPFL